MQGPELGTAIKTRLDHLGWSQHGFVRLVNKTGIAKISPGYLSQLINGEVRRVGSDKLQAFAQVFGIRVDQLLDSNAVGQQPELPGTEDLPPAFASAIQDARHRLSPGQWEMAAGFLRWLASQDGSDPPRKEASEAGEPPAAYGYSLPDGSQPADVNKGEKTA